MKNIYAAYGSNMDIEAMRYRCPNARMVGTGVIKDWRLDFHIHATIRPAEGDSVPIVAFALGEGDEENLDRYEGFPSYYRKEDVEAVVDGKPMTVTAYVMNRSGYSYPFIGYLKGIEDSYVRFGFDLGKLDGALDRVRGWE